jgi:hypothetical protein
VILAKSWSVQSRDRKGAGAFFGVAVAIAIWVEVFEKKPPPIAIATPTPMKVHRKAYKKHGGYDKFSARLGFLSAGVYCGNCYKPPGKLEELR